MNFVAFKLGTADIYIVPEHVTALQSAGNATRLFVKGGETITVTGAIEEVAQKLQGRG